TLLAIASGDSRRWRSSALSISNNIPVIFPAKSGWDLMKNVAELVIINRKSLRSYARRNLHINDFSQHLLLFHRRCIGQSSGIEAGPLGNLRRGGRLLSSRATGIASLRVQLVSLGASSCTRSRNRRGSPG